METKRAPSTRSSLGRSSLPLPLNLSPAEPPRDPSPPTPPSTRNTRKRKLSDHQSPAASSDDAKLELDDHDEVQVDRTSNRKGRVPGTKRACNQCRQQKLKCNVVEEPWKDCGRCAKHGLRCEITADFKRVGKRSQQAELEKTNMFLNQQNNQLHAELEFLRMRDRQQREPYPRHLMNPEVLAAEQAHIMPHDDDSNDAALLLHLKQGHDIATVGARDSPVGSHKRLGDQYVLKETIDQLWLEYFGTYHYFLPLLDPIDDTVESTVAKCPVLFWTVIMIASRHYQVDRTLCIRLMGPYRDLIKETICKPPSDHYVVKALCLLCTWPPPVTTTTNDMTLAWSGIMMKFAMQLGLHRPSHPMDFSRERVQLRDEDISDRLQTWIVCNLVAQNVSTGYGQPSDTVYDSTLHVLSNNDPHGKYNPLHTRLEIEKVVDRITKTVYSSQSGSFETSPMHTRAEIVAGELKQRLDTIPEVNLPLNRLYASAAHLHLRLYVFFDEPSASPNYKTSLNELHLSAKNFLLRASECELELKYAPNYILQMTIAAAVALLKLMNSFFAAGVDRQGGEDLFWDAIGAIRSMSVKANDLPQRLAEVFAQMYKADADRMVVSQQLSEESGTNGIGAEMDASLMLKRRERMSMSHVFDSIWRWKDELQGKFRTEKLQEAVKNPTSPQATAHRGSFSTSGNEPGTNGLGMSPDVVGALVSGAAVAGTSAIMDDTLPGMGSFSSFGGMPLSTSADLYYATPSDMFDTMGWYLDSAGMLAGIEFQS